MTSKRNTSRAMPLMQLVEDYIATPRRGLKPTSAAQLRYSIKGFQKWLGCEATTKHLTAEFVNKFVDYRHEQKHSQHSQKRSRMHLILLWRFAAKQKLVKTKPDVDDVPVVKIQRRNATAWTLPEVEKLLAACRLLRGNMPGMIDKVQKYRRPKSIFLRGVHRWQFWQSLILFIYDTGCRISAALEVAPADIDLDRGIVVLRGDAAKTGLEQVLRLSKQAVEAIRLIYDPDMPRVWYFGFSRRRIFQHFTKIIKDAGLPADRARKFHCLRRTCATLTAAAGRRDVAQATLGHTDGTMTDKYIDRRAAPIVCAADFLPRPKIDGESNSEPTDNNAESGKSGPGHLAETAPTAMNGHRDIASALNMLSQLPLSPEEKAEAVRRLLGEQAKEIQGR